MFLRWGGTNWNSLGSVPVFPRNRMSFNALAQHVNLPLWHITSGGCFWESFSCGTSKAHTVRLHVTLEDFPSLGGPTHSKSYVSVVPCCRCVSNKLASCSLLYMWVISLTGLKQVGNQHTAKLFHVYLRGCYQDLNELIFIKCLKKES